MEQMTTRDERILRHIVMEYIDSAVPVGSGTLVRKYGLGYSSATVRNIMAGLEVRGYIFHPHTSAGRVPSPKGYRYFVERLMRAPGLPPDERRKISHQFRQVEFDPEECLSLAATVLAQASSYAAIVSLPLARQSRVKHLELIAAQERLAFLILVLQNGLLKRRVLSLAEPVDEDDLSRTASRLSLDFTGRTATEIARLEPARTNLEALIRDAVVQILRQVDQTGLQNLLYDGITNILDQPEFAQIDKVRNLLGLLQERAALAEIASEALSGAGIRLIIGEENRLAPLRDCTVILTSYGPEAVGVIGIIGPTRMRYDRAISSLRFVSEVMNNLWLEYYA